MHVRRDALVHIEFTRADHAWGGSVAMSVENPDGQFSLADRLELGPFDTATDVAIWLRTHLVAADLIAL
jgi:hypothetical protein